jgi:hypothetical protein
MMVSSSFFIIVPAGKAPGKTPCQRAGGGYHQTAQRPKSCLEVFDFAQGPAHVLGVLSATAAA